MSNKTNETERDNSLSSSANSVSSEKSHGAGPNSNGNSLISRSPQVIQAKAIHSLANNKISYSNQSNEFPEGGEVTQLKERGNSGEDPPPTPNSNTNNSGLPIQLKEGMEQLSGQSLDDVKVHRNSNKPEQLGAHAYAQGSDIHLGSGQEKHLPHEAWHVVQQKQGRVKPTTQLKSKNINDDSALEKEADIMGAKAIQMKAKGGETSSKSNSSSPSSTPVFQLVRTKSRDGRFGKNMAAPLNAGSVASSPTNTPEQSEGVGLDTVLENAESTTTLASDSTSHASEYLKQNVTGAASTEEQRRLGIGGASVGTVTSALSFFSTLNQVIKEGGEMDFGEKVQAGVSFLESGTNMAASISNIVAGAQNQTGSDAQLSGGYAGSAAGALAGIKSFVASIHNIYTMYKDAKAEGGSSKQEKFESVMSVIENLMATTSAGLGTSKSVMETIDVASGVAGHSAVLGNLNKVIPGFSIAIEAVQIGMQIYALINSESARRSMYERKHELKEKFKDQNYKHKRELTTKSKIRKYGKTDKGKIESEKQNLELENNQIDTATLQQNVTNAENTFKVIDNKKQRLETAIGLLENKKNRNDDEEKELTGRKASLTAMLNEHEDKKKAKDDAIKGKDDAMKKINTNQSIIDDLEEYSFTYDMAHLNKKRNSKSIFKIGLSLTKIAGDVATLALGPGAPAGIALKAAASGVELGSAGFSTLRQAGRNKAQKYKEQRSGTGSKTLTEKVFNADKSDDSKNKKRLRNAQYIMKQMASTASFVGDTNNTDEEQKANRIRNVEGYIKASGAHPASVYRAFLAGADNDAKIKATLKTLADAMAN